jgi:hypothetical protein
MNDQKQIDIIISSFLDKTIDYYEILSKDELSHVFKYINYEKISDRTLADNEWFYDIVDWKRVDKMKIYQNIIIQYLKQNLPLKYTPQF